MRAKFLTKKDAVTEALREEILTGRLPPGTRLEQHDVANRLEVSPTPVREAFLALKADGLVELRPHYGAVVTRQNYKDIDHMYEIRALLEVQALRYAVRGLDRSTLLRLEKAVDEGVRAVRKPDLRAFRASNALFHQVLLRAANSGVYTEVLESLITRTSLFWPLDRRMSWTLREHKQILAALKRGEHDNALLLMRRHMEAIVREYRDQIRGHSAQNEGSVSKGPRRARTA